MAKKKRHTNEQNVRWPDVWAKMLDIIVRVGTPAIVRREAIVAETACWIKGNEMHVVVPDVVRDYVERNMDLFKPTIWPFFLANHCTKLIYETENTSKHYGTEN